MIRYRWSDIDVFISDLIAFWWRSRTMKLACIRLLMYTVHGRRWKMAIRNRDGQKIEWKCGSLFHLSSLTVVRLLDFTIFVFRSSRSGADMCGIFGENAKCQQLKRLLNGTFNERKWYSIHWTKRTADCTTRRVAFDRALDRTHKIWV